MKRYYYKYNENCQSTKNKILVVVCGTIGSFSQYFLVKMYEFTEILEN